MLIIHKKFFYNGLVFHLWYIHIFLNEVDENGQLIMTQHQMKNAVQVIDMVCKIIYIS